jgi:diguanylate cyclase (GGDEF)-like protein
MQAIASGAEDAAEAAAESRTAINQIEKASDEANAQANEMERLAFLDPVTRLPNRRYVETSLTTALDQFHIHKEPFGLLLIDLDRFKATNDELGHINGDRALREVGKILSGELRATDIVGRWGGDEFIAVVPRVDSKILRGLAERCCVMTAQTVIPNGAGTPISLSVSIGGTLALPEDTAVGLIERADRLMYQCKTCGRGRALIDESDPVAETAMKCTV